MIFVGVDWAEAHHDVHVADGEGKRLAKARLPEGVDGIARVHELVGAHAEHPGEVMVGIETDRGLFVTALVAAGYQVYAVNPMSTSRYRDRHSTSGAKSDAGDAQVLSDMVRTDRHNHRLIAGDSEGVEAIKILARAHQTMVWSRGRQTNQLRSTLREFYPAALVAFDDLASPDALEVLRIAPTPTLGAGLSLSKIAAALRRGGRQRRIDERAAEIQAALRTDQLQASARVATAMGASVAASVAVIAEMVAQTARLAEELTAGFESHPDAEVVRSLPGLGTILGARVLGEFGDEPNRYATPKSRKNYAGTSPITRASGTKKAVLARHVRNRRLADAIYLWSFASLSASPGARAYYDARRAGGDGHHQALRALGNRFVGILHGCLATHTTYNEHTAWAHRPENDLKEAA
ncbi:MAG: IS110 family RNA-guided transposase [Acidimicrobiales bacterium]